MVSGSGERHRTPVGKPRRNRQRDSQASCGVEVSPWEVCMIAHQRLIREQHALEFDPLIVEKRTLASSMKNARVEEIDYDTAKSVIEVYEWLGTMGSSDYQFGLYFGEHLAGVVCFGRTAGTKTAASICGPEY